MKEHIIKKADIQEGEGRTFEIEGKKIAVFNSNNNYFAFDSTCPGDGAMLGSGFLDAKKENVSCPWYGHSYSIKTGKSLFGDGEIQTYNVKITDDNLIIILK